MLITILFLFLLLAFFSFFLEGVVEGSTYSDSDSDDSYYLESFITI